MKDNYSALARLEPLYHELLESYKLPDCVRYEAESMCLGVLIKPILCERDFARFEVGEKKEVWTFDLVKTPGGALEFTCTGAGELEHPTVLDLLVWHRAAELILAIRECHARGTLKKQNARSRREYAQQHIP